MNGFLKYKDKVENLIKKARPIVIDGRKWKWYVMMIDDEGVLFRNQWMDHIFESIDFSVELKQDAKIVTADGPDHYMECKFIGDWNLGTCLTEEEAVILAVKHAMIHAFVVFGNEG